MNQLLEMSQLSIGINDVLIVVKLMMVLALLMYVFFAFLITRQVEMMVRALKGALPLPVKAIAWGHMLVSLMVMGVALML